jgi:hypothetical protein
MAIFNFDITRGYPSHVATSSRGQALAKVLQFTLRRGIDVPEITVLGSGDVDFDEILLPLVAQNDWVEWMAWLRKYGRHNLMEDLVSIFIPYLSHGKHGIMEGNNGRKIWKQSNGMG